MKSVEHSFTGMELYNLDKSISSRQLTGISPYSCGIPFHYDWSNFLALVRKSGPVSMHLRLRKIIKVQHLQWKSLRYQYKKTCMSFKAYPLSLCCEGLVQERCHLVCLRFFLPVCLFKSSVHTSCQKFSRGLLMEIKKTKVMLLTKDTKEKKVSIHIDHKEVE